MDNHNQGKCIKTGGGVLYNLIIAGLGGQGINSLAKVLADCLHQSGYHCQFTVHKGGAQSLGSVYAEFRISQENLSALGQGIPQGKLDSLIALEPWEALRHVTLAHAGTTLWVEEKAQALFVERSVERDIASPQSQLDALPLTLHWRTYQADALTQFNTQKMANYTAGLDCLIPLKKNNLYIDPALFDKLFFSQIKKAKR